jgi:hypothetical protein
MNIIMVVVVKVPPGGTIFGWRRFRVVGFSWGVFICPEALNLSSMSAVSRGFSLPGGF